MLQPDFFRSIHAASFGRETCKEENMRDCPPDSPPVWEQVSLLDVGFRIKNLWVVCLCVYHVYSNLLFIICSSVGDNGGRGGNRVATWTTSPLFSLWASNRHLFMGFVFLCPSVHLGNWASSAQKYWARTIDLKPKHHRHYALYIYELTSRAMLDFQSIFIDFYLYYI